MTRIHSNAFGKPLAPEVALVVRILGLDPIQALVYEATGETDQVVLDKIVALIAAVHPNTLFSLSRYSFLEAARYYNAVRKESAKLQTGKT